MDTASNENKRLSPDPISEREPKKIKKREEKNKRRVDKLNRKSEQTQTESNSIVSRYSKQNMKRTGIIVIAVSTIVVLILCIIDLSMNTSSKPEPSIIHTVITELLLNLSYAGITIGAGTILYGYFDFVLYIQEQLKKVIIEFSFTDMLNIDEKKELAKKLEKEIISGSVSDDNTLFDFVQDEILSLTQKAYYEEFSLNINCSLQNDKIVKNIIKTYSLNCSNEPDFDIIDNNSMEIAFKDSEQPEELMTVKQMSINNYSYSADKFGYKDTGTKNEVYQKKRQYLFSEQIQKEIKSIRDNPSWNKMYNVRTECQTKVNTDDITFTYRVFYPSKDTTFIFTYNVEEIEVIENVFVFKDCDVGDNSSPSIDTIRNTGSIFIHIKDWILPGDGILFILSLKKRTCSTSANVL